MNKYKGASTWKIAATYIGTVVGAGFASGQEILQFFGYFGYWGILGLIIATFMFFYFGRIILFLGNELQADSHMPVIRHATGRYLGVILDFVITFFLFGALTTMVAGAGSIFQEQFGLSASWGNVVMVLAALLTVLTGIGGVVTAISFVVPLLMIAVLGISLYTVLEQGISYPLALPRGTPAVPGWPLAAVVYVSYNLVMAVAILGPLGKEVKNREDLKKGALWGGIGLGLGALAILLAVLVTLPRSATYAVPMVYVAGLLSPPVQQIYSIILFAEIYTTAVGSLFGFVVRLAPRENLRLGQVITIAASFGALFASRVGFTGLVRTLFSIVGYVGLLMLGGLLYKQWYKSLISLLPQAAFRKSVSEDKVEQKKTDGKEKN